MAAARGKERTVKRYLAETIGTFVLVFGGVGSAVLAGGGERGIGRVGVSLAFGLSLLAMVYAIGPISGCHVNPAVTVGLVLSRKLAPREALPYVVAQVVGAIVAAGLILVVANGTPGYDLDAAGLGAHGFDDRSPGGYHLGAAFVAEVVLTAFLVLTVLGATDATAPVGFAGIPIGLVLTLIHLVGIPVTNTSVNPARSIGPALFEGGDALAQLWLFIAAPLVGAALAAFGYRAIRPDVPTISASQAERAEVSQQRERQATRNPGSRGNRRR